MKRMKRYVQILLVAGLVLLLSCEQSHKNQLLYRYAADSNAVSLDSLKSGILSTTGTEMLAFYPDLEIVIIQNDRYKTHQNTIETHFTDCGYAITLIGKCQLKEKDQPRKK